MGRLSDTFAEDMLATLFRGTATTAPATYYVALSTAQPDDDGSGIAEPSGGGYARVAVTKNTTNFAAPSARSIANAVDIEFPDPTSGADWGDIGWFALYTASSGGTFLGWGAFAEVLNITDGQTGPVIPAGALIIFAPGT